MALGGIGSTLRIIFSKDPLSWHCQEMLQYGPTRMFADTLTLGVNSFEVAMSMISQAAIIMFSKCVRSGPCC
eukprot:6212891-Pleurochrysis_carterae.AAC.5